MSPPNHRRGRWTTAALATAALIGGGVGRYTQPPAAHAAPPAPLPTATPSDYSQRVVAFVFDRIPITREDLGEYLIARQGLDKLENLVNLRIIEVACQQKGIDVTPAEIESALADDLRSINVNQADFVSKVLKQYGKSLVEWKQDVIRPKLLLSKLARERIQISDEDLQKQFDSQYGPKVEVRLVIFPKGEERVAQQKYDQLRTSADEFDRAASQQATSSLAATGGRIKPIGRGAGTHPEVEREAFLLHPGQVSRLIGTPEGTVVMKCEKHLPADTTKTLAAEKENLKRDCIEKKMSQELPAVFKQLRDQARPVLILKPDNSPGAIEKAVERELMPVSGTQK